MAILTSSSSASTFAVLGDDDATLFVRLIRLKGSSDVCDACTSGVDGSLGTRPLSSLVLSHRASGVEEEGEGDMTAAVDLGAAAAAACTPLSCSSVSINRTRWLYYRWRFREEVKSRRRRQRRIVPRLQHRGELVCWMCATSDDENDALASSPRLFAV